MSNQPTESELKPCPWCKAQNIAKSHRSNQAICMGCGAVGPVGITPQRVIELWNTRPAETELQSLRSEVERLNATLDTILKDPDYEGGVQYWMRKYDDLSLLTLASLEQLRGERNTAHSQNAELVKALEECDPAKLWDLARQFYASPADRSDGIRQWHTELCQTHADALAKTGGAK